MRIFPCLTFTLLCHHFLLAQVPFITGFSPASGPVGITVTINGNNLGTTMANNIVFFGAVKAIATTASATSITVTVPAGAGYQPISVTTGGLTAFSAKPFMVTFAGAAPDLSASAFMMAINIGAGKGPSCITAGDFDGDGKADLAVVNDSSNTLSIFRNLSIGGNPALSAKTDFATGLTPYCVTAGDLDGDGKQDLAVVNGSSNTISLYRNTSPGAGSISFAAKTDLVTGTFPFCVIIKDFDGDGKPDLASANTNSNTISVFKNNSSPGTFVFSLKTDLTTGISPVWLDAGDLDSDGKPDLASANGVLTNSISVLRNTSTPGNISFATKTDLDGGTYAFSIKIGDLDGDNKADIAIAGESNGAVNILLNKSTGAGNISFAQRSSISSGNSSFGITLADMDGDAKTDLVISNTLGNSVSVIKNKSVAGFLSFDQKKDFTVGTSPWVSVAVDLDGDGQPEIASANNRSANISLLKNAVSDLRVLSFTPQGGPKGTTITINGLNFTVITGVSFGGVPAASYSIISPQIITAVVDTGASGNVTVTRNSVAAFSPGFIFIPAPAVTSFAPTTAGSGDTVTITGSFPTGVSAVSFGGIPALSYYVPNTREVIAIVGAGATGNVSVTTEGGTATLNGFVYNNTPLVTSITPDTAPTGATVSISGKHFTGTNSVTFGGVAAASFTIESPLRINAIVGPGASGNVMVTNSTASAQIAGFTYIPPPVITSFSPAAAAPLSSVTITGNYFNGATNISFGGVPAYSFIVNSNTSISAVVGGGSSGYVKVTATGGVDSLNGFNYVSLPAPFVNTVAPLSGPAGSVVTITGGNFSPLAPNNIVYFGSAKAQVLTATAGTITVTAPAGATYQPLSVTTDKGLTAYSSIPFIITMPRNVIAFTASSFAPKTDITVDFANKSVLHDLDGDGKNDLIVLNGNPGLSIYKNTSSGTALAFETKIDYEISYTTSKVAVADLDGDGRPDLVVSLSYSGSDYTWIYRNISTGGNILFTPELSLNASVNFKGAEIADFNGDGKPDITLANATNTAFSIFRNVSTVGKIVFSAGTEFLFYRGLDIACNDLDGDNKPDIVITNSDNNTIAVYRNTSSVEQFSFAPKTELNAVGFPISLALGDFNNDGKTDIAVLNYTDHLLSTFKNTSTTGAVSFETKLDYQTMQSPETIVVGDLDGDSKPDILVGSGNSSNPNGVNSVFKNISVSGQILFATPVNYITGQYTPNPVMGDLNGDGRPEIVVTGYNTISILRNRIGEANPVILCPPLASSSLTSNMTGANYQWQVNPGTGFINISNNSNYTGTAVATLQLSNIPSSWAGYSYRCVVDGNFSEVFELQFADTWTGNMNSAWENPANWTCGSIPDIHTDVQINSGTVVINSNITIRSLKISIGASVTVNTGYTLTILH